MKSYTDLPFDLSSTSISVLVAMLILVGSLGRRHFIQLTVADCRIFSGYCGNGFCHRHPFGQRLVQGFTAWFCHRCFGMGMGGTAIAAFLTPRLTASIGYLQTHLLVASLMVLMAALVWFTMSESPARTAIVEPVVPKMMGAVRLPVTWLLAFLYAVVFGGFVSFSAYLPTCLRDIYDMSPAAAGPRTAGFALAAVVARLIDGTIADRIGAKLVVILSLVGVSALAFAVIAQPQTEVATGATFLPMAAALWLGAGGVFAWVGKLLQEKNVVAVTGIVSAGGGLGGYFPQMVLGATYNPVTDSYGIRTDAAGGHRNGCVDRDVDAAAEVSCSGPEVCGHLVKARIVTFLRLIGSSTCCEFREPL